MFFVIFHSPPLLDAALKSKPGREQFIASDVLTFIVLNLNIKSRDERKGVEYSEIKDYPRIFHRRGLKVQSFYSAPDITLSVSLMLKTITGAHTSLDFKLQTSESSNLC